MPNFPRGVFMRPALSKKERRALEEYVRELVRSLPELEAILLFGSKARRTATARSDMDVLILVNCENSPSLRLRVVGPFFEPIAKYGVDISPFILPIRRFREKTPLTNHIRKEGIILWKKRE